jgi:6-phosphogluconate dehydrogenase
MQLGMIGLGRMGGNMVERCMRASHALVVHDISPESVQKYAGKGATGAATVEELVAKLMRPRAVWVMLPSGEITENCLTKLAGLMDKGDVVIDGGNSFFKDDIRRARALEGKGINYVDVGTSGGVWGLERGYCMMIGGPAEAVKRLDPIFKALAPGQGNVPPTKVGAKVAGGTAVEGYLHCGPVGAGHFVKMVHNGIEYGIMQAYAEGFDIFKGAKKTEGKKDQRDYDYDFDMAAISELWRRGSVVGSWLLDLTAMAFLEQDADLKKYTGFVQDSGEGRWTVMAAVEQAVPADVLTASLYTRFRSRQEHTFAEKVLSAMREKFGGHVEQPPLK